MVNSAPSFHVPAELQLPGITNTDSVSGTLTSITNLATSLARNMDRLSLDEEHYTRQEEWRRQLPESLGDGLRQGLSRLGISLLGSTAFSACPALQLEPPLIPRMIAICLFVSLRPLRDICLPSRFVLSFGPQRALMDINKLLLSVTEEGKQARVCNPNLGIE